MATHTTTKSPTLVRQEKTTSDLDEEIRRRAYELYEQRGRQDGCDLDDWLHAEEEIKKKTRSRRVVA